MEKTYTTFQVADLCGVRPTTIILWVKQNRIKAYVTPGGHRRIRESDLLKFLNHYGFPIPETLQPAERKKILVVEDDAAVGRLIKRSLEQAFGKSISVEWIEDGIQALLAIGKKPADLVILDVVMPVVDGARVLATLKSDPKTSKIHVVGVTGSKLSGEKLKFMQDHTAAFFYKPFDMNELAQKCRELLGLQDAPVEKPAKKNGPASKPPVKPSLQ